MSSKRWPVLAVLKIRLPILFRGHDSSLRTKPRSNIICCPEFDTTFQFSMALTREPIVVDKSWVGSNSTVLDCSAAPAASLAERSGDNIQIIGEQLVTAYFWHYSE